LEENRAGDAMPYEYIDDIAISDVAFRAWGDSMEEVFVAAADATLSVMVEELGSVEDRVRHGLELNETSEEMLLFNFLQELIFLKDAEQLLLRVSRVKVLKENNTYRLIAEAWGEKLNPLKHELLADVKAVTLHRFSLKRTPGGWEATVVLDV
jgi:SHS2 domain-containing protein